MARRPTQRLAPQQARAQDTMDVLIEASERVLTEQGFAGATTNAIAKAAGVSIGTLYRYYPSKDALLAAVVERQWLRGITSFVEGAAKIPIEPFGEHVERVVELAFDTIIDHVRVLGKMELETFVSVRPRPQLLEQAIAFVEAGLASRGARVRPTDLRVASVLAVRGVFFLTHAGACDYPALQENGRYKRELAQMIRRYLEASVDQSEGPPRGG